MNNLSNEALSKLADELAAGAVQAIRAGGSLLRTVYGVKLDVDDTLTSAVPLSVGEEELTSFVRFVRDAQRRFDAACVIAESSATSRQGSSHARRLDLLLYVENGTYLFAYELPDEEQKPRRLRFSRIPDAWEGLAPDIWELTAKQCGTLVKRLDRLLREQPPGWEVHSCEVLEQLWVNQRYALTPLFDVISADDLPAPAQRLAHAQFEQMYAVQPRGAHQGSAPADTDLWLCAATLSVDMEAVRDAKTALPGLAKELVERYEQHAAGRAERLKFLFPSSPLLVFDFIPVSMLAHLINEGGVGRPGQFAMMVHERAPAHLQEVLRNFESVTQVDFLVLGLCEIPAEKPRRPMGPGERPFELTKILAQSQTALVAAATHVAEKHGVTLHVEATTAFDALREMLQARHEMALANVVQVAQLVRKDESGNPLPVRAELVTVAVKRPEHVTTFVTVWREDGSFVTGLRQQRLPYESVPAYAQVMRQQLLEAGAFRVDLCPTVLRVDELPKDPQSLTPLLPDLQGSWFSPRDIFAPGCREVVRKLEWEFSVVGAESDPTLLALPVPHLMLRQGLVEAASGHYTPGCYRAFKDAAADLTLDTTGVWERVQQQFPVIEALETKLPGSVLPPLPCEFALRLHWSRSPTLKVRQTLLERLNFTNLNLDVPMHVVRAPFPLSYVHFERRVEGVEWEMPPGEEGESPSVLALEGAFVHSQTRPAGRRLYLLLLARGAENPALTVSQELFFDIDDESLPLSHYLEQFRKSVGIPEDALNQLAPSVEVLAKVLLYLGVKNARTVSVSERTDALKDLSSKKPEKQLKVLSSARGLYDHILVGPEQALELPETPGLSGRTMPVHTRRGHLHYYWTGPRGSAVLVGHYLEPVIVNKRLLDDPDKAPPPKNYRLR